MRKKRLLWGIIMLLSAVYAFSTLMVYLQSDYQREYCEKVVATVTDTGRMDSAKKESSYSHRYVKTWYYQDIWIEYSYHGEQKEVFCEKYPSEKEGYDVGEEITCYVDSRDNVTYEGYVRDNIYGTLISSLIFAASIYFFIKAGKANQKKEQTKHC